MYNLGSRRYYIRSVFAIPDQQKMEQEQKSLIHIDDSFKKIIVVKDWLKHWQSEKDDYDFFCTQNVIAFCWKML